jgi:pimeloyl-ACP methyl ester carboxylesterase
VESQRRGRGTARALALAGAALLAAGAPLASGAGTPPAFVETPCWWPIPGTLPAGTTITCGTLAVPADRDDAEGGTVTLAVARVHREGADAAAPPILVLHGGPGGNALSGAPAGLAALDAVDAVDLIAFDQRGSGRSLPSLNCPEKEEAVLETLSAARSWSKELRKNRKAAKACRRRLLREGVDLDDFHTLASIADMESIREAFGFDTWNVYGGSYGTRLALAYARLHPARVRSLVLDSVYPPDVGDVEHWSTLPQRAIDGLGEACAADPACNAAYPNLGALVEQAVASFDADPHELEGSFVFEGSSITRSLVLTGADVRGALFSALYQTGIIPLLPSVIAALASGDRSIVPIFVSMGVPQLLQLSEGAYYSIDCADGQSLFDEREAKRALRRAGPDALVTLGTAQAFCAQWKVESLPASFNEPVEVDVPTLVFGGTLDPITPHADSAAQAARMPNARFVSVPRGGHGGIGFSTCTLSAANGFWADPSAELPACATALEPLPFATP